MPAAAALPNPSVPRAALVAARFLRPPGRFKRAELREHPRSKTGAFANLVKTAVRLREKARAFSLVPPPRLIPIPLPARKKHLESVRGVPTVSSEVLARRLHFLLGPAAIEQQKAAKMQRGLTPYQTELFMWERQMREIRKIYRAQYLQRLAEVTEEERQKQLQLYLQEKRERRLRREEHLQRIYDDKKRRAVLKDRMRIEKKVTQSLQTARVSRRKIAHVLWLKKLQDSSDFLQEQDEAARGIAALARARAKETGEEEEEILATEMAKLKENAFENLPSRNVSVPDLLAQLGLNDEKVKSIKKKITGTDNVFRHIMEDSFAVLPEDGPEFEEDGGAEAKQQKAQLLTDRQRAVLTYAGFTEAEKMRLLDEKIDMLNKKLDEDYELRGAPQNLVYLQLRDHLQAAKISFREKLYVRETQKRLQEQQGKAVSPGTGAPANSDEKGKNTR
ncbi:conserved hypothetical protein [Neospora caninum Liverpool]|uniref:Uncharacterized protein n=1 Tax=Neospora caninum (strain Liverpool) TaxID=572307 RepID=F0VM23_NEOCL|nr:conserved hypothetical protein [Neospora caninum Liverpool]CBZ54301.1 conserved hypothetical protein [Neospora caninum Liverpool]CEL69007.1 TPA: hypothetical protein BN1204_047330 [Neospora caninum Liverpool]|eukprot:XP_003884332.1 conserved hypothetical protein [Neospora caninum Liverpool]